MNIDNSFNELEKIVSRMENQSQSIEEALEDYQKGMQLITALRKDLTAVEKKIQLLNTSTGEIEEIDPSEIISE